ncbi:MAG TPA: sugar transferase [Firmicutes bacterium]|nr:sugar transferase [Bacillota bacterium]
MKRRREYKRTAVSLFSAVILLIFTAIFAFVWYRYYSDAILIPFFRKGNWLVIAVYFILTYVFTQMYGGYKIGSSRVQELVYSQYISVFFINILTYFQISLIGRMWMDLRPVLVMTAVECIVVIPWAYFGNRLYLRLYPPKQMLMVYGSNLATGLTYKMSQRADKYRICRAVHEQEGAEAIFAMIPDYEAIVICDIENQLRNQILKFCYEKEIRVYLTPKISDIIIRGAESIHLFDSPLLLCRNHGLSHTQKFCKRILDLFISAFAIVITSPVMLVTALAIKLYDGGSILYKQERLTLDGKKFYIYKFRSMVMHAEKDGVARLSTQSDDRITPVGRVIRKIRCDELPQFFNIFKGDMSVVGPRPERPEIAAQYQQHMPEFDFRLKVKAGLTGYAQLLGKYNTSPYDKLKLDLMYVQNYSFLMDLRLILMTIKVLFIPESTEGIPVGKITAEDAVVQEPSSQMEEQKENLSVR